MHARRAGDRGRLTTCLGWLIPSYAWGPAPAREAIARVEEIRAETEPGSFGEASALTFLGWLKAMNGEIEKGRALYREGTARMTELGALVRRGGASLAGGHLEMLANDPVAAEAVLREGFRLLDEMGEKALLSTVACNLADAVCRQGRFQEAEELTHVSEEAADPEDIASQVGWRSTRALVLAVRGEAAEAERLSAEAARLMEPTDALVFHAHTLLIRAEVLRLAGRIDDAATTLEEAIRLYERKGVLPALERSRALLSELTG